MEKGHQLRDLLNTEKLQKLQDTLAEALEQAYITVDYRGRPVIEYSGFTDFCNIIRKDETRRNLCYQCDAHGGLHATITGEPYIYRCHSGLVDYAVPLILEGKYMGSVMCGQIELIGDAPNLEPIIPQATEWEKCPELVESRRRVHKMTYQRLLASVYLVRDTVQSMLEEEYRKVTEAELEKKNQELIAEKAARIHLEAEMEDSKFPAYQEYVGEEYIFYILNVLARLAYREKAEETERAVCDFASMMRYLMENGNNSFVTVGEELEYIGYYLQIQKRRLETRLTFAMQVPERYYGVLCPFMLLQPLVDSFLKYTVEPHDEGGCLTISGEAEGELFVLTIEDSGAGMSPQQISTLLDMRGNQSQGKGKKHLTNMNWWIKNIFGSECGVSIRSRAEGFSGTQVQIRLPLANDSAIK